ALREARLRAEPTGLPCAKRACERSPRACPARSEPASGAHGPALREASLRAEPTACPARSEPASGAHGPALREASLRAEPTGLRCAKRACERSTRACPARSEPASGAHGLLLRMTFRGLTLRGSPPGQVYFE